MVYHYHIWDVFTEKRFGGTQLPIFYNPEGLDKKKMKQISTELKVATCVFLYPGENNGEYRMRVVTPEREMSSAGLPAIGAAFFVANQHLKKKTEKGKEMLPLTFIQEAGTIKVTVDISDGFLHRATMELEPLPVFPYKWPNLENYTYFRHNIASLLSLNIVEFHENKMTTVTCGNPTTIVQLRSIDAVKRIRFRADLWDRLKELVERTIYVFAVGGEAGGDVHGRMFEPELGGGVSESAAAGSANGALACYLWRYGIVDLPCVSEQGFELGRPSFLHLDVKASADDRIEKVLVGGSAVAVGEGDFYEWTE